jgi:hypothetical protein
MNSFEGNNFNQEQISDYFKMKAGHKEEIRGEYLPKSIQIKSDCTQNDMNNLIDTILEFGKENDIQGCFIDNEERKSLIENYN